MLTNDDFDQLELIAEAAKNPQLKEAMLRLIEAIRREQLYLLMESPKEDE